VISFALILSMWQPYSRPRGTFTALVHRHSPNDEAESWLNIINC
jgi:hypothetical protein